MCSFWLLIKNNAKLVERDYSIHFLRDYWLSLQTSRTTWGRKPGTTQQSISLSPLLTTFLECRLNSFCLLQPLIDQYQENPNYAWLFQNKLAAKFWLDLFYLWKYFNIRWIHLNWFCLILLTFFFPSLSVTVLLLSTLIQSSPGVHQWLLLVLFWERCYWWARPAEFFQGNKCGQAGFQYAHWVHPGMKKTALKLKSFVVCQNLF